ncbi:MAG: HAD family phosphatase [Bacteroidota bacterium]
MNKEIKVILFDLGRVLMHIDFEAFPNGLGLLTEEQRAPYQIPTAKLWRLHETGKMSTDEFLDSLYHIFNRQYSKEQILEAWNGIIVGDNEEIVPFVRKIQKQYRTAILSNTSPSHWEKVIHISPLVRSIPHHFTSFGIGAMKPDPVVYRHVADALNVQAREIFFIDDLKENVEGAVKVGMQAIVYKGTYSLPDNILHT